MYVFLKSFFTNPIWITISGTCTVITIIIWIIQVRNFIKNQKQKHHINFKYIGKLIGKSVVIVFWLIAYLWLLLGTIMSLYYFWVAGEKSIPMSTKIIASITIVFIHWGLWGAFKEKGLPYLKK